MLCLSNWYDFVIWWIASTFIVVAVSTCVFFAYLVFSAMAVDCCAMCVRHYRERVNEAIRVQQEREAKAVAEKA